MSHNGTEETRKARRRHSCNWCGGSIPAGTIYENKFQVCEGAAWRSKMHVECGDASRAFDYNGDTIALDGNFQRGHTHEWNWDTVENGAKAGCPGCIKELGKKEFSIDEAQSQQHDEQQRP